MGNEFHVSRVQIAGFQGRWDVEIKIQNNRLIIVGENGSGKTTLLRIMYHFLSAEWAQLASLKFTTITSDVNGRQFTLSRKVFEQSALFYNDSLLSKLPPSLMSKAINSIANDSEGSLNSEIEAECEIQSIPSSFLWSEAKRLIERSPDLKKAIKAYNSELKLRKGLQFLYLPTYRRIERELQLITRSTHQPHKWQGQYKQDPTSNTYLELVEFGMKDVESLINDKLRFVSESSRKILMQLTYGLLSEMIVNEPKPSLDRKKEVDDIHRMSFLDFERVLNRVDDDVLPRLVKQTITRKIKLNLGMELDSGLDDTFIWSYVIKLVALDRSISTLEKPITSFVESCNRYLIGKKLVFDQRRFEVQLITTEGDRVIRLNDLSSGEKQIVSLFGHIHLSEIKRYFIIIDEPELSLSVDWQRHFLLDISDADRCEGLFAATHSPFVYDNRLVGYAHSIGEFLK